jgi:hypothetical protein
MYKVSPRDPNQTNFIKIEWNLGKRCNYDCSYCPSIIHDNSSPHTSIETLKATVDKIASLSKPVRLSFTGGEPCVHPKFRELINYCKEMGVAWISVTTNGTLPYEFYASLPIDQYVISLHLEYDWDRVLDTIIKVASQTNKKLVVQVMALHTKMADVKLAVGILKNEFIPFAVRRIRWTEGDHDLFNDMKYELDDLKWIKDQTATAGENTLVDDKDLYHANDVIKLHLNQYKGWMCNAGIESLMINWDGDVHRATCRVGGSLGNIYLGSFTVPVSPIICDRNFCTCAADIPLTKLA